MRKTSVIVIAALLCFALGRALSSVTVQESKSRAYVGHANDADMQAFVKVHPEAAGTRLDDCQTCHRGGLAGTDTEREYSPCGYCHLLVYPNPRYKTGLPADYEGTLNSFGLDYKKSGRNPSSISAIAGLDSDRDGFANSREIRELRLPGDPLSRPGQPLTPFVSMCWEEIRSLPAHTQFMLMNTTKEPFDDYVSYTGVRVLDLLKAARVPVEGIAGITVFAPDGYSIDYGLADIMEPFPRGYFYAAPETIKNPGQAFVRFTAPPPSGLEDGKEIPDTPWLLLAFERSSQPLDMSVYEKGTGRLAGEGPYRLVRPQRDLFVDPAKPGRPDRSQKASTFGDGWDYNPRIDHNAGFCVRGACVIRVNPIPSGYEEYDWKNGWPLVEERKIVIYGKGVVPPSS